MTSRTGILLPLLLLAAPANAILVDTSTPQHNEQPPPDDPGWRNIGRRGQTTAIYLGDGWVLTARHSGLGPVELEGQAYQPVEDSEHWVSSPGGGAQADLLLFRIEPAPDLPGLALRRRPVRRGEKTLLIGYGQGRGDPAIGGPGFRLDPRRGKRWGTNRVEATGIAIRGPLRTLTHCFAMTFTSGDTAHEAQATVGDSGGAVFVPGRKRWRLAGVMLSVAGQPGQAKNEVLYGNQTQAADLSAYAPEIQAVLDGTFRRPEPVPEVPAHQLP